jgi:hypothetical protein
MSGPDGHLGVAIDEYTERVSLAGTRTVVLVLMFHVKQSRHARHSASR